LFAAGTDPRPPTVSGDMGGRIRAPFDVVRDSAFKFGRTLNITGSLVPVAAVHNRKLFLKRCRRKLDKKYCIRHNVGYVAPASESIGNREISIVSAECAICYRPSVRHTGWSVENG